MTSSLLFPVHNKVHESKCSPTCTAVNHMIFPGAGRDPSTSMCTCQYLSIDIGMWAANPSCGWWGNRKLIDLIMNLDIHEHSCQLSWNGKDSPGIIVFVLVMSWKFQNSILFKLHRKKQDQRSSPPFSLNFNVMIVMILNYPRVTSLKNYTSIMGGDMGV